MRGTRTPLVAGLLGALGVPLVVAAVVAASPRWFPLSDLAMTELRVRDVGSAHPPLVGLPGRMEGHGLQGSHPGPLSFYALSPTYRLLGSTAWAMEAGVVVLNVIALGAALAAAARRRPGVAVVLGVAVALGVTMRALGPEVVSHAWNPFLPVLWWPAFLLAVWSVLDGDRPFLPVAVFAGSFCAQTHVSYGLLVAALGLLAFGWALVTAVRGRRSAGWAPWWWLLGSLVLAVLLWVPPLEEEGEAGTGNLSILVESFGDPATPAIGLADGFDVWCSRLDPWGLLVGGEPTTGTGATVRAMVLLAAWLGSVALAWRRRAADDGDDDQADDDQADDGGRGSLLRLDLVLAVALVVGLYSLTRISGVPWFYLHLWGWGTTALVLMATGWSLAAAVPWPALRGRAATAGLAAAVVVVAGACTWDTAHREEPVANLTRGVRGVLPEAMAALRRDDPDREGVYLVEWIDPVGIGDQGWSLLNELEREGFDANVGPVFAVGARDHRVVEAEDATALVTLVVGPRVDEYRARPGVTQLSFHEPRTRAEQARFGELRAEAEAGMLDAGVDPGVLDESLLVAGMEPGLSPGTQAALAEMQQLGLPLAVFVEEIEEPEEGP